VRLPRLGINDGRRDSVSVEGPRRSRKALNTTRPTTTETTKQIPTTNGVRDRLAVSRLPSNASNSERAIGSSDVSAGHLTEQIAGCALARTCTYGMVQYDRLSIEFRSGNAEGGMDFESGADRQTLGL
jgi:hypothetical protein